VTHLARDLHDRRLEVHLALRAVKADVDAPVCFDAVELGQEIDVEERSPEFAVGDAAKAQVLLIPHDLADCLVLDLAQRIGADRAPAELLACV
jgi:hypothetical protein